MFKNGIKKICQKYAIYVYIIIIYSYFFFKSASYRCCGAFADDNAIYFTTLRWIMNVWDGFETLKTQLLENAF